MSQFKIADHRNGVLLAIAGAMALSMVGCGEKATPTPAAVAALPAPVPKWDDLTPVPEPTPEQKRAELVKKAEAGDANAQLCLGLAYAVGVVTLIDLDSPAEMCAYQIRGVSKDTVKAIQWFERAAAQGNAEIQTRVASIYADGRDIPKNAAKAVEWYQKAAVQGSVVAQFQLAGMYGDGKGVSKDSVKAMDWYQKAAAQGMAQSQYQVAWRYHAGEGVPKDGAKAVEWYEKAAAQGYAPAQHNLGVSYSSGKGVPKDAAKAVELFQKAAAQGIAESQSVLGARYANGTGVPKDMVLAYAWANLAAGRGLKWAVANRDLGEAQLSSAEKSEAQRLSSNWKMGQILVREGRPTAASASSASVPGTPSKQGTGTAFFVNKAGQVVTNHHVVAGCKEVRVEGREGVVKVSTTDVANDLALLQVPGAVDAAAAINSDPAKLRQGDDIVVFGFPLNSVLSSGGNLTPGIVSAVTGLGNNTNQIQITAPIQPGSSGSPVLNRKGEVVGVVSAKLSDSKMAKATGSVGQNVNFAVSGQTLKSFLDAHKVEYSTGGVMSFSKSTADLADEAKKWTTVVECWK